jgi:hypothetical protein
LPGSFLVIHLWGATGYVFPADLLKPVRTVISRSPLHDQREAFQFLLQHRQRAS